MRRLRYIGNKSGMIRSSNQLEKDVIEGNMTIFSDNMILSSKNPPPGIGKTIRMLVRSIEAKTKVKVKSGLDYDFAGWKVNPSKVSYKVITPSQGVKILGLVINDRGEINISHSQLRSYRLEIYDLIEALQIQQWHTPFITQSLDGTTLKKYHRVMGIISYVDMVYSGQGRSTPFAIAKPSTDLYSIIY